jgi:hypothetical protein
MRKAKTDLGAPPTNNDEEDTLTHMGRIYNKILNFSIVTRYFVYVLPLGILFAIPIIVGATVAPNAQIINVRIVWIFGWVEVAWLSLWVSKIFAKFLPWLFQFVCGVVSSGTRKYAALIEALEIPISLVGWAVSSLVSYRLVRLERISPGAFKPLPVLFVANGASRW